MSELKMEIPNCFCMLCEAAVVSNNYCEDDTATRPEDLQRKFRLFCDYMEWEANSDNSEVLFDFETEIFPFCGECERMVENLYCAHDVIQKLSKRIEQLVFQATAKVINSYKQAGSTKSLSLNGSRSHGIPNSLPMKTSSPHQVLMRGNICYDSNKVQFYRNETIKRFLPTVRLSMLDPSLVPRGEEESIIESEEARMSPSPPLFVTLDWSEDEEKCFFDKDFVEATTAGSGMEVQSEIISPPVEPEAAAAVDSVPTTIVPQQIPTSSAYLSPAPGRKLRSPDLIVLRDDNASLCPRSLSPVVGLSPSTISPGLSWNNNSSPISPVTSPPAPLYNFNPVIPSTVEQVSRISYEAVVPLRRPQMSPVVQSLVEPRVCIPNEAPRAVDPAHQPRRLSNEATTVSRHPHIISPVAVSPASEPRIRLANESLLSRAVGPAVQPRRLSSEILSRSNYHISPVGPSSAEKRIRLPNEPAVPSQTVVGPDPHRLSNEIASRSYLQLSPVVPSSAEQRVRLPNEPLPSRAIGPSAVEPRRLSNESGPRHYPQISPVTPSSVDTQVRPQNEAQQQQQPAVISSSKSSPRVRRPNEAVPPPPTSSSSTRPQELTELTQVADLAFIIQHVRKQPPRSYTHQNKLKKGGEDKIKKLLTTSMIKDAVKRTGDTTFEYDGKFQFELKEDGNWSCMTCSRELSKRNVDIERHCINHNYEVSAHIKMLTLLGGKMKHRLRQIDERKFIYDEQFVCKLNDTDKWYCYTCNGEFSLILQLEHHIEVGCPGRVTTATSKRNRRKRTTPRAPRKPNKVSTRPTSGATREPAAATSHSQLESASLNAALISGQTQLSQLQQSSPNMLSINPQPFIPARPPELLLSTSSSRNVNNYDREQSPPMDMYGSSTSYFPNNNHSFIPRTVPDLQQRSSYMSPPTQSHHQGFPAGGNKVFSPGRQQQQQLHRNPSAFTPLSVQHHPSIPQTFGGQAYPPPPSNINPIVTPSHGFVYNYNGSPFIEGATKMPNNNFVAMTRTNASPLFVPPRPSQSPFRSPDHRELCISISNNIFESEEGQAGTTSGMIHCPSYPSYSHPDQTQNTFRDRDPVIKREEDMDIPLEVQLHTGWPAPHGAL